MLRTRILAATALAVGFAFTPAKAAIVLDGNFNDPLASGTFQTVTGGNFFGNGDVWGVVGNSVDVIGNYWQAPPTGGGSVDLSGNDTGGIAQLFNVAAGTYKLSFYLSGNPDGGAGQRSLDVLVGGQSQLFTYNVTAANSRSDMDFILESLIFTSKGTNDILAFLGQDSGPYGAVIGGVSISAVPEAATWMMMILGFGGIGMMLRGRRQASLA